MATGADCWMEKDLANQYNLISADRFLMTEIRVPLYVTLLLIAHRKESVWRVGSSSTVQYYNNSPVHIVCTKVGPKLWYKKLI